MLFNILLIFSILFGFTYFYKNQQINYENMMEYPKEIPLHRPSLGDFLLDTGDVNDSGYKHQG